MAAGAPAPTTLSSAAVRFDYYDRLSRGDKRTYRRSDDIVEVRVPEVVGLHPVVARLEKVLAAEDRRMVEVVCQRLCDGLTRRFEIDPLVVKVRATRPKDHSGELHGLYTSDGSGVLIEVWMRTAEHQKVVSFRTFLRTLLHEVGHHLDLTHFELEETFHTEGFFRRESSLMRQLCPPKRTRKKPTVKSGKGSRKKKPVSAQLALFQ